MALRPDKVVTFFYISGDRLRQLMESIGLTQVEMAEKLGVLQPQLSRWLKSREVGLSSEQWRSLESLADAAAKPAKTTKNDRQ